MRITKKIPMVRYISRTRDEGKEIFDNGIWFADKEEPELPYYKIKVKIVETEDRYDHERKDGKKPFRWVRRILKHV